MNDTNSKQTPAEELIEILTGPDTTPAPVRDESHEELCTAMRNAGHAASRAGKLCAPAIDPEFLKAIAGRPVGKCADLSRAWVYGHRLFVHEQNGID